ncbi:hypothetical protein EV368DRAFT_84931 [Lentinula lateritia]|nr:hypothetical protein EV368DRAFT_84931 [Lentinula lateritia]
MSRQIGTGARWSNTERDLHPGSIFNELIVLPTLAPGLARQEYLDPTAAFIPFPQPRPQQEQDGAIGVFSSPQTSTANAPAIQSVCNVDENDDHISDSDEIEEPPARVFDISIATEKIVITALPSNRRSNARAGSSTERSTVPGPSVPLLDLLRCDVINDVILSTVNGNQTYAASPLSGPHFSVQWKGLTGGKSGALVVQTDQEWSRVQNMLRGSPRVTAVTFHFNITESLLTPYLHSSAPLGQAPFTNTAVFATQVPAVDQFTAREQKQGTIILAIEEAHPCTLHGCCYIAPNSQHVTLSHPHKNDLVDWILASEDTRKASDPIPNHLLQGWGISTTEPSSLSSSSRPSRSVKGPRSDASDLKAGIMEGFGFATGAMMQMSALQAQAPASFHVSASTHHSVSSRSLSPVDHVRSSSPPAPEDELDVCIDRFSNGLTHKLSSDIVHTVKVALKEEQFDVQLLAAGATSDLSRLTGLKQGPASGLKRFAEDYHTVLEGKHARHKKL